MIGVPSRERVSKNDEHQERKGESHKSELSVPISDGQVARIPFPLSEEDFNLLVDTLQLWKGKLTKDS